MQPIYDYLFPSMWLCYMAYWWAKSSNVKASDRIESVWSRLLRLAAIICAVVLLLLPSIPLPLLCNRFVPRGPVGFGVGAAITAVGLLFSIRARCYLGSNWSQAVTVKENHELITSGPYALVRHPIYSGLLLGFLGSAVARGEWRGLLAVALIFIPLWFKLRLEEAWMRKKFGETYETYSRRVAALIPFVL